MPIRISQVIIEGEQLKKIAWLGDNVWLLPPQIKMLEKWLTEEGAKLPTGDYVADIGFSWRRSAGGGGSVLSLEMMKRMTDLGITLFLSEFPGFADDEGSDNS